MPDYRRILEEQLAIDYACTPDDVRSPANIYRPYARMPQMRPVGEGSLLKLCVYNEKLLVMAVPELLPWCREHFADRPGTWLSEPGELVAIHQALQQHGHRLADVHHHYLPCTEDALPSPYTLRWYGQHELEPFRGDPRFGEALLFDPNMPDMLAVCAIQDETILGMASVTRNCEKLWEIGVNTTPEGRGLGIAAITVSAIKAALLRRGIVPTYATVESHIKSQRVAAAAGFVPVMFELFSNP